MLNYQRVGVLALPLWLMLYVYRCLIYDWDDYIGYVRRSHQTKQLPRVNNNLRSSWGLFLPATSLFNSLQVPVSRMEHIKQKNVRTFHLPRRNRLGILCTWAQPVTWAAAVVFRPKTVGRCSRSSVGRKYICRKVFTPDARHFDSSYCCN